MKTAFIFLHAGTLICVVGIVFLIFNWITGFINSSMTTGASAITICALVIALFDFQIIRRHLKATIK